MRTVLLSSLLVFALAAPAAAAPVGKVLGSIPAPGPCTTGLTWDGKNLWASDHKTDTLYRLDPRSGKVLGKLPSPGYRPAGLAWDGKRLWNADPEAKRIYRLDPRKRVADRTIVAPVSRPLALGWDGGHLWLGARRNKWIRRLDQQDGTTVNRKPAPSGSVNGMVHDGRYLWITDRIADKIHVVHPPSGEVLFSVPAPGPHSTGIAFDGRHLWVADYQTDRIYRLEHAGDTIPVRKAQKTRLMEYTHQVRNLGPGTLQTADVYLAIPRNDASQKLHGQPRFSPRPTEVVVDQWGQRVARFRFNKVGAGRFATVSMKVKATLYDVQHRIFPHKVKRLASIPRPIRKRYLVDGAKFWLRSPTIRKAAREAVGGEKNAYWIARKIYRYVHKRMHYKLAGGWNVAPRVLERGNGSCSEYSFVYIAMCRAAGLPARYAGAIVVRKDDASYDDIFHRWVEVFLPGYGWVPVDPSRGDKDSEVARADAFGHLEPAFVITTRGGGGSKYLGWKYNSDEKWSCKGRCRVQVENIAEWALEKGKAPKKEKKEKKEKLGTAPMAF